MSAELAPDAAGRGPAHAALIEAAARFAKDVPGNVDWVSAYFRTTDEEILAALPLAQCLEAAHAHRRFAAVSPPEAGHLRVDTTGDGRRMRLLVVSPDRPFLVDSLLLNLRRAGARVHWVVHPLLALARIDTALPEAAASGPIESLVQVLFEPPRTATAEGLASLLRQTLQEVHQAVADYPAICRRLRALATDLRALQGGAAQDEAAAFVDWLVDGHFTFLGLMETTLTDAAGRSGFHMQTESGLGLARPNGPLADTDALMAPSAELDKYAGSTRLVVVTKAMRRATVHHDEYLDVISIKHLGPQGGIGGTVRVIGLFTSDVYDERPRHIPLLRAKIGQLLDRAGVGPGSHAGKQLRDVVAMLPRDELWQSSEEELYALALGVHALRDQPRLRLFLRRDRYGRYFSALVYVPRERYTRDWRDQVVDTLMSALGGTEVDRRVEFPRGGVHARLHLLIRTPPGTASPPDVTAIEAALEAATRTWVQGLEMALRRLPDGDALWRRWGQAFDRGFTEATLPEAACDDIAVLEQLDDAQPIRVRLLVSDTDGAACVTHLRLYSRGQPAALSEVLPRLEHFGLFVIEQDPGEVRPVGAPPAWVHRFEVRVHGRCVGTAAEQQLRFETAFHALLRGEVEDDSLHRLVLLGGLGVRDVVILRLLTRYLVQTGLPYSRNFMMDQLVASPSLAAQLVALFHARFDPAQPRDGRAAAVAGVDAELDAALEAVPGLDADRVLRACTAVIRAGLRTNFYLGKPEISLKLDPRRLPELPLPRPMFEIYVYSTTMEGVHLRGGQVARGGLRWSDRLQDYRTEVLGLMKAQQVKNSIIVPGGAKGGFVLRGGDRSDREAWSAAGRAAYVAFLRGLLDLTDNREGQQIVAPAGVVCHDGPDPYLVVAADKGTARFSDLANATAAEYGFWLGDAFASGGSQGYDHKAMGITARGAWESVRRHFRALGADSRDIQTAPFTVIGIGDMSGDVFGNGMLLSPQIRLIAAFDHRHIFIDPNPDPARSFAERQRLFALPRSSWADYDPAALSPGGGIFERSTKQIALSPEARAALATDVERMGPFDLIHCILQAPADLLWNGGIGTYVKASHESHAAAGDRGNDAVRVDARDLRVRVIGEGGNLGLTQAARIEFSLGGGLVNTDAVDNAGGVHSSDREVNIKIPLNTLMREGTLDRATRDPLLVSMTDDLIAAVLHDNRLQSGALGLMAAGGVARLDEHLQLLTRLERDGYLDRRVEGLPDDERLQERRRRGLGLTRPELAVLLAYAKIALFDELVASEVPDDPALLPWLIGYFPAAMVDRYGAALAQHQLRREIIATVLANAVCNRMGAPFAHRVAAELGVRRPQVVQAWARAHALMDADLYWAWTDAPTSPLDLPQQQVVDQRVGGLLKHVTRYLLTLPPSTDSKTLLSRYAAWRTLLADPALQASLPPAYASDHQRVIEQHVESGFDRETATTLATTRLFGLIPDLVMLDPDGRHPPRALVDLHLAVGERFALPWLQAQVAQLQVSGRWPALARGNLRDDVYRVHRQLTAQVLPQPGDVADAGAALQRWSAPREERLRFLEHRLSALRADGGDDFMRLVVAVRELFRLCAAGT